MKKIMLVLLVSFLVCGCSENKISEEIPYTVQIKEIRSYYKALDIQKRVETFGVDAYILSEETEAGNWYRIVSGAEKTLEKIQEVKESIQNKVGLDNLEIINYQNIESNLVVNFEEKLKEKKRISSTKPDLPAKIFNVIDKFPEDDNFIVKSFFIVNCPDSVKNLSDFRDGYKVDHDLPRGISMKSLMKKSECIAEVIYEDNLFEDQLTIDIIQLKKDHGIEMSGNVQQASLLSLKSNSKQLDIANYFAELILATGKYSFEDKIKINVSSYQDFSGYKVTLKPSKRKDEYRTYFVLVSEDLNHLVFSQSTEKTEKEILDVIKDLGDGNGLNSYDEFYNAFYTLPTSITDKFVCFATEKLTSKYARSRNNAKWARKMVGHWETSAYFYNEDKRAYAISLFDLLYSSQVDYIYKNLYVDAQKSSSRSYEVEVLDKTGIAIKGTYPSELSFPGGRYVIVTSNQSNGKLKLEDMLDIAKTLQINN